MEKSRELCDTTCKPMHHNIGVAITGICTSVYDVVDSFNSTYTPPSVPCMSSLHLVCMVICSMPEALAYSRYSSSLNWNVGLKCPLLVQLVSFVPYAHHFMFPGMEISHRLCGGR